MRMNFTSGRMLTCVLSGLIALAMSPVDWLQARGYTPAGSEGQSQAPLPAPAQAPPGPGQASTAPEQPPPAQLTPQQLQELVAPIALYPDSLVAQILAASAYPTQIVEADRFLQDNQNLQGKDLASAVDQQDWDPSVKALTQFPSVLSNMDKDLGWTSELGDANYNEPQAVMDAIQYMRRKAQQAGHLQSTPQQTVSDQGNEVVVQPANPQVVYVPEYDPAAVYGYPVPYWPGFYPWWGVGGPLISFGVGFNLFPFFGFSWGWPAWGCHWGYGGGLWFHGGRYPFRSHAFYDRNAYFHGNYRGYAPFGRGDRGLRGFAPRAGRGMAPRAGRSFAPGARGGGRVGPSQGFRGRSAPAMRSAPRFSAPSARSGHFGAFGGITRGGDARTFSSRGHSSFGGGFHGGGFHGGGFHGGGGHGGGGRH